LSRWIKKLVVTPNFVIYLTKGQETDSLLQIQESRGYGEEVQMLANEDRFKIFTGNANPDLAREIAAYLGTTLGDAVINRFNNGEVQAMINESVRGKDVFIVQPTCGPIVNDNVMELLIMADAFKRASANHIIAVIPFYGYARQDRKARGREPITAKLMADMLQCAGITRVVTIDLHAAQIQGFFNIPLDHMPAAPVLADYIKQKNLKDMIVVSPDLGGVSRARVFAERLNCGLAIIDKRRPEPGVAEVMNLIGNVEGKTAIMVDDMVDTAGSLTEGAKAIKKFGAKEVYACCTHPILTDPALNRIAGSEITELVVTNTIPLPPSKKHPKIKVLSIAPILAETMLRIFNDWSVSQLFEEV